jgi:hypothetical protein
MRINSFTIRRIICILALIACQSMWICDWVDLHGRLIENTSVSLERKRRSISLHYYRLIGQEVFFSLVLLAVGYDLGSKQTIGKVQ